MVKNIDNLLQYDFFIIKFVATVVDDHHQNFRNDKNDKVKATFDVKLSEFMSAKLVHLSLLL